MASIISKQIVDLMPAFETHMGKEFCHSYLHGLLARGSRPFTRTDNAWPARAAGRPLGEGKLARLARFDCVRGYRIIGTIQDNAPMLPLFPLKFAWHVTQFSDTTGMAVATRR